MQSVFPKFASTVGRAAGGGSRMFSTARRAGTPGGRYLALGVATAITASLLLPLERASAEVKPPKPKQITGFEKVKHSTEGNVRVISMDEVKLNDHPASCWVVIEGKVWDVTDFYGQHPGGSRIILNNGGRDVTELFKPIHPPNTLERNLKPEQFMGIIDPTTVDSNSNYEAQVQKIKEARARLPPVENILGLDDMEAAAKTILSDKAAEYYRGGSDDEITLNENIASFRNCRFLPSILRNVHTVTPQTKIFGHESALPIYISPASNALLGNEEGEVTLVRGASATGIVHGISAVASLSLTDIITEKTRLDAETGRKMPMVYQVYVQDDKEKVAAVIKEAIDGGLSALLLTVDTCVIGNRQKNDVLKGVTGDVQPGPRLAPDLAAPAYNDPSLSWDDLRWLKSVSRGVPIYLKGVCRVEDVRRAKEEGLAGVILSNHGGRQLDRSRTAFDSLRSIARSDPTLLSSFEVYLDGGVRRGNDVLAALCLGARGVGLGRPFLYAQSAYGEEGVVRTVRILEAEITRGMRLLGVQSVDELKPDMLECIQENWGL